MPEFHKPLCALTEVGREGEPASHWTVMFQVTAVLRRAGLGQQAMEFARRAVQLTNVDEDTTELLGLAQEYVEIV